MVCVCVSALQNRPPALSPLHRSSPGYASESVCIEECDFMCRRSRLIGAKRGPGDIEGADRSRQRVPCKPVLWESRLALLLLQVGDAYFPY